MTAVPPRPPNDEPWLQTFTGRRFTPHSPRPEDVCIEDIAHALALQCRFAGHCRVHYSVAEHSVRVSWLVESWGCSSRVQLAALLHDGAEAYCVDVPRPIKPALRGYREIETACADAIAERFSLSTLRPRTIAEADAILLATEARDLMVWPPPYEWQLECAPMEERIVPWSHVTAEAAFLARFRDCGGTRG